MSGYPAAAVLGAIRRERLPELARAASSGDPLRPILRAMIADAAGELGGRLSAALEAWLLGIADRAEDLIRAELLFAASREEAEDHPFASGHPVPARARPLVLGDAASDRRRHLGPDAARRLLDGRAVAGALAVAIREAFDRGAEKIRRDFAERTALRRSSERQAETRFRQASRKMETLFLANARTLGMDPLAARAAALAAGGALRVSVSSAVTESQVLLGASAVHAMRSAPRPAVLPVAADRWRVAWRTSDRQGARQLGTAALSAAFGEVLTDQDAAHHAVVALDRPDDLHDDADAIRLLIDRLTVMRLPWTAIKPLLPLSVKAAVARLQAWAEDFRLDGSRRENFRRLAEAVKGASIWRRNVRSPFAQAIGIERWRLEPADAEDGMMLYEAVPISHRFPARIACRGNHGRTLTCNALADGQGRLVGYGAFDPWSREMGGKALRAFYRLDGRRAGRIEVLPRGLRLQLEDHPKFVSAPETLAELAFSA